MLGDQECHMMADYGETDPSGTAAAAINERCAAQSVWRGIPAFAVTENQPQFARQECAQFAVL